MSSDTPRDVPSAQSGRTMGNLLAVAKAGMLEIELLLKNLEVDGSLHGASVGLLKTAVDSASGAIDDATKSIPREIKKAPDRA